MKLTKEELKYIKKLVEKECDERFVILPDFDYRYQLLKKVKSELKSKKSIKN